jgi:hypothetical protein
MPAAKSRRPTAPRRANRFREREMGRILRAASNSGVRVKEITVDPTTGKYTVVIGDSTEVQTTRADEVEDWITKHANKR